VIKKPVILSLCDYTGTWSQPYQRHYDVIKVDLQHGDDIRLFRYMEHTTVEGIIAQPPCDHFAVSGARWWAGKGEEALIEGLQLVDACLRIIAAHNPRWWVLENPVGRLRDYIGAPKMYYHPYQYAKWADDPYAEAYTKKTCLWGTFNAALPENGLAPDPNVNNPIHFCPPGPERKNIRSKTPQGFARAFYYANNSVALVEKEGENVSYMAH
jgi:site-specific DNA-cytosine methylase